jgi:hypothetical protein
MNGMLRGAVAVLGLAFGVACGGVGGGSGAPIPVVAPPLIVTQPQSTTVEAGHFASLSVVATGEKLTYTWRKNGLPITGLSSATIYTFQASQEDDGSLYSVVVSNPGGSVTSQDATLTVAVPFTDQILNGSFESLAGNGNAVGWNFSDSNMTIGYADMGMQAPANAGAYFLINGYWGDIHDDSVYQSVTIPGSATQATLTFKLAIANLFAATPGSPVNTWTLKIKDNTGAVLATLLTRTDLDSNVSGGQPVWNDHSFDLMAYQGQTIRICFESSQSNAAKNTLFGTDLVSLKTK